MAKVDALYDRDFVLWTEEQAAALRRGKGSNLPLDWENLAEEIESLGKSDRRALSLQIRRILHRSIEDRGFSCGRAAGRMAIDDPNRKGGDRGHLARQSEPAASARRNDHRTNWHRC